MMKKTVIAAATLAALSGAAAAQSSVTLYGVVDVNVSRSERHNGDTLTGMNTYNPTNARGPRFGMRGSEDLGGGMKGLFVLEGSFSPESGTTAANNQLFDRQAWVGVSAGWGELTVGRQETMTRVVHVNGYTDVTGLTELSVASNNSGLQLMQNMGNRVNNAIRYTTPTFSGVKVRVQSGLGKQSNTATTSGAVITYDQGPVRLALSHEYYEGIGIAGVSKWNEVTTVGASYKFSAATLVAGYQDSRKVGGAAAAPAATTTSHEAYSIGAIVPVSKALTLRAQYTMSTTNTPTTSRDYSRAGVSARYSLSPRTFLYAAYNQKDVDVPTATDNKNSLGLGVSHAF